VTSYSPDPAGEPSDSTTLVELLDELAAEGFAAQLEVRPSGEVVVCATGKTVDPGELTLHSMRRLEGASDPADMVAVAAVSTPDGVRGTLVLKFGPDASEGEAAVLAALH
jgi:hypothetical protein